MERDASIGLRLPRATRAALEHAAELERRSMSDLTVLIITDWLTAAGHLPKPRAARRGKG